MFSKFFTKGEDDDYSATLPKNEATTFKLWVDHFTLGILTCENGEWKFVYTDEFKKHQNEYTRIVKGDRVDKLTQICKGGRGSIRGRHAR